MLTRCRFCQSPSIVILNTHITCANCGAIYRKNNKRFVVNVWTVCVFIAITIIANIVVTKSLLRDQNNSGSRNFDSANAVNSNVFEESDNANDHLFGSYRGVEDKWESDKTKKISELKFEFVYNNFVFESHEPFLIIMERSRDLIKDSHRLGLLKDTLTKTYNKFMDEFQRNLNLPKITLALPVVLFYYKESFDSYCSLKQHSITASSVPSIYEYSNKRTIAFMDHQDQLSRINHEAIHQLVDYYTGVLSKDSAVERSFVLQEGLGCYFEVIPMGDSGGLINWSRLIDAKLGVRDHKQYQPLKNLLALTLREFWEWHNTKTRSGIAASESVVMSYALSWGFVHFMNHYKDGLYKSVFFKYLKKELEGEAIRSDFEKFLYENHFITIDELDEQFRKYILSLN